MDGKVERIIQTLKDILRDCVLNTKSILDAHIHLIEFSCNNIFHYNIHMVAYKVLYGRRCKSMVGWLKVGKTTMIAPDLIHEAINKFKLSTMDEIHAIVIKSPSRFRFKSNNEGQNSTSHSIGSISTKGYSSSFVS